MSMKKYIIIGSLLLVLVAGTYYLATADSRHKVGHMMTYDETAPENTSMGDGMDHASMGTTTDSSERAFLEHMIPHHLEAVTSAQAIIASGTENQEIIELANNIIVTQSAEVTAMKSWHLDWFSSEYKADDSYKPMMRDTSSLSSTERDRAFLEDMIAHHVSALEQGQAITRSTKRPEIITLATSIAETQSEEIITMRILLNQLAE